MEQFAVDTISPGGALGVLFVLFLIAFGWCFVKIRDIEKRLDDGDSRFKEFEKSLGKISDDVSFIRGLLEGKKEAK
jgi:hypothetical protein